MDLLQQIDTKQIDKVISYSQGIENPKTDKLYETWARAKAKMARNFLEGKVRYTFPDKVSFELDDNAKQERFNHLLEHIFSLTNRDNTGLANFLDTAGVQSFYNNSLDKDFYIKPDKKIQAGTKIIKAFKYFIDDEKLLFNLQNKASELIQANKVEGYLTFSIHPLDFLSSSENTYNWRSCHALDGEYRAGNLSYMCDSSTMMVYLSPDKDEILPRFPNDVPWNSKKWRMLMHFDTYLEVCFAGRQYPFFSPGALDVVFRVFSEQLAPRNLWQTLWGDQDERELWQPWVNDYIEKFKYSNDDREIEFCDGIYCVIQNSIVDKTQIMKDAENSRHYNDVLKSSCYLKPYYMFKRRWTARPDLKFVVGAAVPCLYCGENLINGDDSMMCSICECNYGVSQSEDYYVCDNCGCRFFYPEGCYVDDGDYICPDCADNATFICEDCAGRYYEEDARWIEDEGISVCRHCYNERNER